MDLILCIFLLGMFGVIGYILYNKTKTDIKELESKSVKSNEVDLSDIYKELKVLGIRIDNLSNKLTEEIEDLDETRQEELKEQVDSITKYLDSEITQTREHLGNVEAEIYAEIKNQRL